MATCKDCLHLAVCYLIEHYGEDADEEGAEIYCSAFKDRSKYVVREKGEWVLGNVEPGYCTPGGNRPWVCPRCGGVMSWRLDKPKENFCPNCGADMRTKEQNRARGENG